MSKMLQKLGLQRVTTITVGQPKPKPAITTTTTTTIPKILRRK